MTREPFNPIAPPDSEPTIATTLTFDGVICFGGEDWWYHNRGHYDMQMMRQLADRLPVLYVNSIGMRMPHPGEGRMFLTRVRRKLHSIRRGLVRITDRFAVYSPLLLPNRLGVLLTKPLMVAGVKTAAVRLGIRRPLVWVACPTAAEAIDRLDPVGVVYQRTDRYESFRGVDSQRILQYDTWLKARADLTVFCSTKLHEQESSDCRCSRYVDHGVDVERFVAAADSSAEPADLADLPHPRVGFIGAVDAHTFDPDLFLDVARQLPDVRFVLVGPCSLMQEWCRLPNVTLLGQRPFEQIAGYMAACDVLIMPWLRSRWIEACNPVKLKEYLATGRPVVSTYFPELQRYAGLVRVADDADTFVQAIREALADSGDVAPRRLRVRDERWTTRLDTVLETLAEAGLTPPERSEIPTSPRSAALSEPPAQPARTPRRPKSRKTRQTSRWPDALDLEGVIILAGGLRPSPLVAETGLSSLDLWITPTQTLLAAWVDRCAALGDVPIRVVHDAIHPPPWPGGPGADRVTIEQDPKPLRGTAGVIGDLCRGLNSDGVVVVLEGARYLDGPLHDLLVHHARTGADITVSAHEEGTPAGMYVLRCGTLELIPTVGFMDLKEQWLRRATDAGYHVGVHTMRNARSHLIRTREDLLAAARVANSAHYDEFVGQAETLRVICPGAFIGPGATVLDSIVMPGAVVASETVAVRSILCPGAQTQPGVNIVDEVFQSCAMGSGDLRHAGSMIPCASSERTAGREVT